MLVSTQELRDRLGVSRATIYRWRLKGMPVTKVGYNIVYDYEKVLEWVKQKNLTNPLFKALSDNKE